MSTSQLATMELAAKVGISKGYASDILNDKQAPSRSLAIHIFRTTGWRHRSIADLTDEQMRVLEEVDPWTPKAAA
jgi:transcriptional regulator with XRE-family HTH domain